MKHNNKNRPNKYWGPEIIEKQVDANLQTQGARKMFSYFLSIIKSDAYNKRVKKLRKKYKITGRESDQEICNPPTQLNYDVEKLCKDFSLHPVDWHDYFLEDIYFRRMMPYGDLVGNNLCRFIDLERDIFNEYFDEEEWKAIVGSETTSEIKTFPLAIMISPYATKRDILDYVQKMFPTIRAWQELHRDKNVKIGKIRSGNPKVRERDEFIYQNRDKPGKEIKRLVYQKFGVNLFYEYIPKIISREKKKRQKM